MIKRESTGVKAPAFSQASNIVFQPPYDCDYGVRVEIRLASVKRYFSVNNRILPGGYGGRAIPWQRVGGVRTKLADRAFALQRAYFFLNLRATEFMQ